jgi:2-aminoadipate transaminase
LTFPAESLATHAARVIRERKEISLQYGPTPGLLRLREIVAAITRERKIECATENVFITSGSQQALSLIAHAVLDPGDVVLVELPTYIGGSSSFTARRAELAGVEQDDDGVLPDSLRDVALRLRKDGRRVKFFYTIPNFQNPSGRVMSQPRRREVLRIATELDFLILEDDPYGELVYQAGVDTTPIKTHDTDGRVVYLSSFSKVLSPGLRCGWIIAEPAFLRTIELAKEAADLCSGMLDQSIVEEFCAAGELPAQIERVRAFYRERRATLIGALEQHFRGRATWTSATGGLFTFVTLSDDRDTQELVPRAIENGVAYVPGAPFFVDGSGRNTMRLTFAKEPDDRMREGVARLADVFFGS